MNISDFKNSAVLFRKTGVDLHTNCLYTRNHKTYNYVLMTRNHSNTANPAVVLFI